MEEMELELGQDYEIEVIYDGFICNKEEHEQENGGVICW